MTSSRTLALLFSIFCNLCTAANFPALQDANRNQEEEHYVFISVKECLPALPSPLTIPDYPEHTKFSFNDNFNRPFSFSSLREVAISNVPEDDKEREEVVRLSQEQFWRSNLATVIDNGSVDQVLAFMSRFDVIEFTKFEALLVVKRINRERGNPIWTSIFDYLPLDSRFRTLATAALELMPELAKSVTTVLSRDLSFMREFNFKNSNQIYTFCEFQ